MWNACGSGKFPLCALTCLMCFKKMPSSPRHIYHPDIATLHAAVIAPFSIPTSVGTCTITQIVTVHATVHVSVLAAFGILRLWRQIRLG